MSIEGDDWDTPDIGEQDDAPMAESPAVAQAAAWYRVPVEDRFDLPEFSFLRLRKLGCTDPTVLAIAQEFDEHSS